MIPLTPELEKKIKESGKPMINITLEDLAKAKPIYKQKDGKYIQSI